MNDLGIQLAPDVCLLYHYQSNWVNLLCVSVILGIERGPSYMVHSLPLIRNYVYLAFKLCIMKLDLTTFPRLHLNLLNYLSYP